LFTFARFITAATTLSAFINLPETYDESGAGQGLSPLVAWRVQ
jgi:hypothetical protein